MEMRRDTLWYWYIGIPRDLMLSCCFSYVKF